MDRQRKVVLDYGAALDAASRVAEMAHDTGALPHPKETIRAALLDVLESSSRPEQRQLLNVMLLRLADFQPGVGDPPVPLHEPAPDGTPWAQRVERERRELAADLLRLRFAMPDGGMSGGDAGARIDSLLPEGADLQGGDRGTMLAALQEADRTLAGGTSRRARENHSMAVALQAADMSLTRHAEQVLTEYGRVLEAHAPAENGIVVDVTLLPHPKTTIRAALLKSLQESEDPDECEFLKSAFIKMADFQEGVGEQPAPLASADWTERVTRERRSLAVALDEAGFPISGGDRGQAERVLAEYGAVLETLAAPDAPSVDASQLPHPKSAIDDAILELIGAADDPRDRHVLKIAFIRLAQFQEPGADAARVEAEMRERTEALAAAGHPLDDAPSGD